MQKKSRMLKLNRKPIPMASLRMKKTLNSESYFFYNNGRHN